MKFSHKIAKLGQPLTYQRTWRKLKRGLHPVPLAPLMAKIDAERLHALQAHHLAMVKSATAYPRHYVKYLDVAAHLKLNIRRAQDLNFHRSPPQDVLDLGCGGGFFLFVLKQHGHSGLGLDIDAAPLFRDLVDLLGVERVVHEIRAFEPLPETGRRFDWITAFSTAFHGRIGETWRWGTKEWSFFLDDLKTRLKPGGRIFFGLNPAYAGDFYTPEIRELFLSRGAAVERENVLFPPFLSSST